MARTNGAAAMNIADLERMLGERRSELGKLHKQRSEVQKKLDALDKQIARLDGGMNGVRRGRGGGGGGGRGSRARNERSLLETIESVLRDNGNSMRVSEIVEAVLGTGYRSNSVNFRGIVNQTLIKDKRFTSAERGLYQLKSSGEPKGRKEKAAE